MRIYLKNNPAVGYFVPIRFETTEPIGFWRRSPNNKKEQQQFKNNKISSDMRSVFSPKWRWKRTT